MSTIPAIITPTLLNSIKRCPNLPRHTWYLITAATLSILNRPDEIPKVFKHAIELGPDHIDRAPDSEEQLKISRRIREALIKSAAIGGLPKVRLQLSSCYLDV
jgi:hypothetical protein